MGKVILKKMLLFIPPGFVVTLGYFPAMAILPTRSINQTIYPKELQTSQQMRGKYLKNQNLFYFKILKFGHAKRPAFLTKIYMSKKVLLGKLETTLPIKFQKYGYHRWQRAQSYSGNNRLS